MRDNQGRHQPPSVDYDIMLAHSIGHAFVELQQLEYTIISYLNILAGNAIDTSASFDLFASKTFGNLIREMRKHRVLEGLADEMLQAKEKRDFFIHKFLFHRYGGELLTTASEFELLIREAYDLGALFAKSHADFHDHMLRSAPIVMFAGKFDPNTGELSIVESEFAKKQRNFESSGDAE